MENCTWLCVLLIFTFPAVKVCKFILEFIYYSFISRPKSLSNIEEKHNLAIVFGASSGIGKSFAKALANRKFDVLIIARREKQLQELETEIEKLGQKCQYLCCDASNDVEIGQLAQKIDLQRLGVAVYSAGVCNEIPNNFCECDKTEQMLQVNVCGLTKFTSVVLPYIKENHGLYVLFSSETGVNPAPLMAVYSATKAYTAQFAEALAGESKDYEVIAATPFWVASEMTLTSRTNWRMADPDKFVERLLAGNFNDVLINPWWSHKLFELVLGGRRGVERHRVGMEKMKGKVIRKLQRIKEEDEAKKSKE